MKIINFWKPIIIPFVHVKIDPTYYGLKGRTTFKILCKGLLIKLK